MNKTRLLISLVIAIAATGVALRHRTIRQLKTEQTQLRQQINEAAELRAAIAEKQTAPPALTNTVMSSNEHLELLRLRNEVGQLRRELAVESNQLAKNSAKPVSASADSATKGVVTKAQMVLKVSRGREWALALMRYANENDDQWPATLADAAKFAPKAEGADDFELLATGKMSAIKVHSRTIAFREKQPWKASNGKWGRAYVFADGHSEIRYSATEDFAELERQMTQIDPALTQ
jgi:hypothetical protein